MDWPPRSKLEQVCLCSPWQNRLLTHLPLDPAHDLQAMDRYAVGNTFPDTLIRHFSRAFRFGQNRDVSVYRLLGAGSVEELIYARQIYKQQQMAIGYEASVQTRWVSEVLTHISFDWSENIRYFEGIQGDNAKKGELFGINNIFKLHEDKLATKMAVCIFLYLIINPLVGLWSVITAF